MVFREIKDPKIPEHYLLPPIYVVPQSKGFAAYNETMKKYRQSHISAANNMTGVHSSFFSVIVDYSAYTLHNNEQISNHYITPFVSRKAL